MDRLTKRGKTIHENGVCCTHFDGPECRERLGMCTDNCPWEENAWSRLADYEDSGLEPKDILGAIEMANIACALNELNQYKELGDLPCLRKLVQADKEGKCVVLPCKVGERIYKITPKYLNKYGCDHCLSRYGMGRVCEYYDESSGSCKNLIDPKSKYDIVSKHFSLEMVNEFGKTVFLTREAAENALKERDKNE